MPKKFPTYAAFAKATIEDIFGTDRLATLRKLSATELASGVFLHRGDGTCEFQELPRMAQIALINSIVARDLDGNGVVDLACVGNNLGPELSTDRFNGGLGIALKGDGHGGFRALAPGDSGFVVTGEARAAVALTIAGNNRPAIAVARCEGPVLLFAASRPQRQDVATNAPPVVRFDACPTRQAGTPVATQAHLAIAYPLAFLLARLRCVALPARMPNPARPDGRRPDQLRDIVFQPDIAPHADGSVLVSFGNTRVICAAMLEPKVPSWMRQQGVQGGWVTAEYSMLPYSTLERKQRDISRGKIDGRTVEIQRLIGRSMRAVLDLKKLGDNTLWIDCDVLQADGGTRTAAITGAYVATRLAVQRLLDAKRIPASPLTDSVAAVSVGVWEGVELLDLAYLEDKDAEVDFNIVMTGEGRFVEVQGTGEETTFSRTQLDELLALAERGLKEISSLQNAFLAHQFLSAAATPLRIG